MDSSKNGNFLQSFLLKILRFLGQRPSAVLHGPPGGQGQALHGPKGPGLQTRIAAVELVDQLLDLLALSVAVPLAGQGFSTTGRASRWAVWRTICSPQ